MTTKNHKDWLDLDVDSIEPMELSPTQKVQLKQTILNKNTKKRTAKWLRNLAAAAIIGVSAVTTINFTFPTLATQIPFMKNIVNYFDNNHTMFENFENYATEIGQVQTSNGISMMIESAVYDGTSVTISYALETEIDLGPNPRFSMHGLDIKNSKGIGAHGTIQKVSDTNYVGLEKITPHFDKEVPDEIEILWRPQVFTDRSKKGDVTEVKGDWAFQFKVPKLLEDLQLVNETVTNHGVTARFTALAKNDLSTVIHYEHNVEPEIVKKWPYIDIQFEEIRDNLGNIYIVDSNGSQSSDYGIYTKSSGTVQAIDPAATSITIVPEIYFSLGSGKGLEVKKMDPVTIHLQ